MDYEGVLKRKLDELRRDNNYRAFTDIRRVPGSPSALWYGPEGPSDVTVWCSNDYLGMGSHPQVISAMTQAAEEYGVGAGGALKPPGTVTRFLSLKRKSRIFIARTPRSYLRLGTFRTWLQFRPLRSRFPIV